jgi:VanZ family protein
VSSEAVATGARVTGTSLLLLVILVLSLTPGHSEVEPSLLVRLVQETPSLLQKALHVSLYALLTVCCLWTLRPLKSVRVRLVVTLAITFTFGVVVEWLQISIPGRFGSLRDLVFNGTGITLGLLIGYNLLRLRLAGPCLSVQGGRSATATSCSRARTTQPPAR